MSGLIYIEEFVQYLCCELRNCSGVVRIRTRFSASLSGAAYFNNVTISRNIVIESILIFTPSQATFTTKFANNNMIKDVHG